MTTTLAEVVVTAISDTKAETRAASPTDQIGQYNQLNFMVKQKLADIQTAAIVLVNAVDTVAKTVNMQVLVQLMATDDTPIDHGIISNVPYYALQGGVSGIILPPAVNDIGLAVFCSRDTSGVKNSKQIAPARSARMHDYSDGMYFGGFLNADPTQFIQFLTNSIQFTTAAANFSGALSTAGALSAGNGWTGTFRTGDSRTATVSHGIITNVA